MKAEINFKPWIGEKYLSEGFKGKRILVLGESHYCPKELAEGGRCFPVCEKGKMNEDCFSQTEEAVNTFVYHYDGKRYLQTYLCFERAVLGKVLSQEEREDFWQRIIFYNYSQFSVRGSRTAPQGDHWQKSEDAFKEILEEYMPDYIIMWGVRLFDRKPNWGGNGSVIKTDSGDETDVWTYTIKGKKIPAIKVYHPSTPIGKSWPYWHEFYVKFLGL